MAAVPHVEIKEAWLGGKMTPALHDFDMGAMCSFLVEEQCDYRSLRDSSYQMYHITSYHIKHVKVQKCISELFGSKYSI